MLFFTAGCQYSVPTRSTREGSEEGLLVKPYGLGSSTPSGGAGVLKQKHQLKTLLEHYIKRHERKEWLCLLPFLHA